MFNRTIQTCLSNLKMYSCKQATDIEGKFSAYVSLRVLRNFYVGDRVWIRNYQKGDKWIPGTGIGHTGLVTYQVKSQIGKQHKHVDQLRYKPDDDLDTSIESNESPTVINDHNVSPGHTEEYHQNLNKPLVSVPMNTPTKIRDYNEAPPTSQTPIVESKPEPNSPNQNTNLPIEKPMHNDTNIQPRHN